MNESRLSLRGKFVFRLYGPDGRPAATRIVNNGITLLAINNLFDVYFRNGSPAAAWFLGLIDNTDFDEVDSENDSMSTHAGWTELTAEYDEATRPAWGPDAAASQAIANSLKATFTFNAAKDVRGFFVTSSSTKGGTTGTLWSTAVLDVVQSVQPGQVAKVYYSLTGQEG